MDSGGGYHKTAVCACGCMAIGQITWTRPWHAAYSLYAGPVCDNQRNWGSTCGYRGAKQMNLTCLSYLYLLKPKFHLARYVTSRHATTRSASRASRARRVERVGPCCSTSSTAKTHGLDTSNVSCRVVSRHDVMIQVEYGLYLLEATCSVGVGVFSNRESRARVWVRRRWWSPVPRGRKSWTLP